VVGSLTINHAVKLTIVEGYYYYITTKTWLITVNLIYRRQITNIAFSGEHQHFSVVQERTRNCCASCVLLNDERKAGFIVDL